ncbi:T9SS type A sorting domain-containing protein [candidate division KSB1 bacterium]|nr:T9SS type A sorting domain-containing protein [candidate division KSB1 bacterium]
MKSSKTNILMIASLTLLLMAALAFAQGPPYVLFKVAPSGPDVTTTSSTFVDIPEMTFYFYQYNPSHLIIMMSAEAEVTSGKRMFIRAQIDGSPTSPSDVILANDGFTGCHAFNFTADVDGGIHEVRMQYKVDGGGTAYLGDRAVCVIQAPDWINTVAPPSGPDISTNSSNFVDIPDLSYNIEMPSDGDAVITISAEAEVTNGKRMFLRALVDGQTCSPADVVFAQGAFKGTHSFTFVKENVTAGSHAVKVQWLVDSGGTAYMGDRSFTFSRSSDDSFAEGLGGIKSISAPSGPDVTTTSGTFVDIPDMTTTLNCPENGNILVCFSAEAEVTPGKRMFVRAMVDGETRDPNDVVFSSSAFYGTCSMNFMSLIGSGAHQVTMQYCVDAGGTAYLGDRNMTIYTSRTPCPNMTDPFNDVKPAVGDHPLLVILWDPHRPTDPAPGKTDVENLIFGANPSVRDYFIENSNNLFFMNKAGVKGWYDADKPWDHYWGPEDTGDSNNDGWIHGHVEKWAEAVRKADATFDFASYDKNGNGTLETDELGVLMVIPQNSPFGTVRVPAGREHPSWEPLVVDGVTIPLIAEAYIGAPPQLGLTAHELSHLFLNLPDMYYTFFFPYAAGVYSLMDATLFDNHLDPFHKIRLGWIQPAILWENQCIPLEAVETSHVAFVLHDPVHGVGEYFILENRQPNLVYDSNLPDQGMAIWHIMEDTDIYKNLPAPTGVDPANWATIGPDDWGRRVIRMIRPVYGPPFDNTKALWDGSDPVTGYDVALDWHDGTPSGFVIKNIGASGQNMQVCIEGPWKTGTAVEHPTAANHTIPDRFSLEQNFPNPFNPETTILFNLDKSSRVTVKIFNLKGEQVIKLLDRRLDAGAHELTWSGLDKHGNQVASGMYFYQVQTDSDRSARKMMLMR